MILKNKRILGVINAKKNQKNILRFFGVLKNRDWEVIEKNISDFRKSFNARL